MYHIIYVIARWCTFRVENSRIDIINCSWAYAAFRKGGGGGGGIMLIGDLNICFECYSILNTCDVRQSY